MSSTEQLAIDAIRVLSMDAVQKANSGHPGTPMALAPVGYVLFHRHLSHNPRDPEMLSRGDVSHGMRLKVSGLCNV